MKYFNFLFFLILISCQETVDTKQPKQEDKRLNIIYIMADDHAYQAISAYGSSLAKYAPTPNIDRLADEGALMNATFCTKSICGRSRSSILTGKFSHSNGFKM